ncbi:unnamed protein product [Parascedosporium putredinis]|uniref:Extracellular serine-rich protein n=1 Tax=Parascedosporium putredinis TaxID=1442378 RepID=A0A9P1H1V7_9PEZI|nr:unnamed protein product [Parascedosporium putredinis]CAI7993443.1 unnamed protein product [Parascedosporium putredinis]
MRSFIVASLVAAATAAVHKINVGQGGLTFTPDSVTAEIDDIVEFHFVGGTHDAGTPGNTNVFHVVVNSTEPHFYYCSVGMHCANGMVAVINPSEDQTIAAYKAASQGKPATAPNAVYGGEFGEPLP